MVDQLNSSQRMLLALKEARVKIEAMERSKAEPIAIIGMSCRFPGGANDPDAFWQLLINGVDAITEVPRSRWNIDAYYDPDPDAPGKMYTRYGGFLQQVDQFDAQFFGISPREAVKMDPQQRLLLEVSWEALENAGLISNEQAASQMGVFVGITTNDYARLIMPSGDLKKIDAYYLTGNPLNAVPGRLSYTLGLQGPCMAIDTACSSSLVSIHVACQSLRNGECSHALAGGVNLILTPENNVALSKARMLSADGRCKTFDAEASGIVRGEGCGMVVLKRLSDALADGDNISALIRGSAINQDGHSSGFTVPNKTAQEILIRLALAKAKVDPSEVDYIEAHGTGTSLGDPLEIRALGGVFSEGRSPEQSLKVGSVKTNLGHLESAAGIASLMKVVLSLQHQTIPPHLHLKQLNPYVNWNELPISVTTKATPWSVGEKRRIAGISSFGASGINAHIIVEDAPSGKGVGSWESGVGDTEEKLSPPLPSCLTISAKTKEALKELGLRYEKHLAKNPGLTLEDICFSANTGRRHFKHRLSILASSTAELSQKLAAFNQGQETSGVIQGDVEGTTSPKIAFLFTGQGSQYVDMGRELYDTQPTFCKALQQCDEILRSYLEHPLLEVLYPDMKNVTADERGYTQIEETPIRVHLRTLREAALGASTSAVKNSNLLDETAYTQPALFALEYALFQLWKSWGIEPAVVMGHSVGEYLAALSAGVFSLEDGLKLIAARGRLMQALPQDGEMVAVLADPEQVSAALKPYEKDVSIAAINGPRSIVISGKREAVRAVCAALEAQGAKTKALQVSHAFHSPLMEPMLAEFRRVAEEISFSVPKVKLISNLTGLLVTQEIATPEYWCRHILSPVQFASSMRTLNEQGYTIFVEIGPKPTLLGMGRQCVPEEGRWWLPSLRPGQTDWQPLLQSLGELYVQGVPVDWKGFHQDELHRRVVLPTYPFQRERFWVETIEFDQHQTTHLLRNGNGSKIINPLVGQRLRLAELQEIRFESYISEDWPTFLKDHRIYEATLLPGTAYMEMALSAGAAVLKSQNLLLEDVAIQQVLVLKEDEEKVLQIVLKLPKFGSESATAPTSLQETATYSFEIFSSTADDTEEATWTLHASGKVRVGDVADCPQVDLTSLQSQCVEEISGEGYYQGLRERGFDYGPNFQGVKRIWQLDGQVLGEIRLPAALTAEAGDYQVHPVLLDSCFHVLGTSFPENGQQDVFVPVGVEQLQVYRRPGVSVWCQVLYVEVKDAKQQHLKADLCLLDDAGNVVTQLKGLSLRRVTRKVLMRAMRKSSLENVKNDTDNWLYEVAWRVQPLEVGSRGEEEAGEAGEKISSSSSTPHSSLLTPHSSLPIPSWLIFADEGGMGLKLAQVLKERGDATKGGLPLRARALMVSAGAVYEQLGPEHFQINPSQPEEFVRLLDESLGGDAVGGVVYLWGLDQLTNHRDAEDAESGREWVETSAVNTCGSVLHLVQALAKRVGKDFSSPPSPLPPLPPSPFPRLWLVTKGAQSVGANDPSPLQVQQSPLWGLGRVIALEHPELRCVRLDLDPLGDDERFLVDEVLASGKEDQVGYREGVRYVARLVRYGSQVTEAGDQLQVAMNEPFQVKISDYGILENLTLKPMTRRLPGPGEVEVQVRAVGLNFRDVLNALGMLREYTEQMGIANAEDLPFGGECAGLVVAVGENVSHLKVGDEVIAAQTIGSLASHVIVNAEFVVLKPQQLSFEEAATIPTTFLTAYYGLYRQAKIQAGERVLIHSAAGGVGQAAVQLAHRVGARIFGTASPGKWDFLRSVGVEVMNSRTLEFAEQVMESTSGLGVDVVLNSLNGEFIPKSFEVLGRGGRFVEIGKLGIWEESHVQEVRPDVAYFPFDLLDISLQEPGVIGSMLEELMAEFRQGSLKPLPHTVFPLQNVVGAFRYMAQAKHIGKVVVTIPESPGEKERSWSGSGLRSKLLPRGDAKGEREVIKGDSSYLITGGLGALGLKVARWMVAQGARYLVLTGRSGSSEAVQQEVSQLEQAGAQVLVVQADVSQRVDVSRLLDEVNSSMPPLRGIVHAAGVLEDGMLLGQTWESFDRVMAPKVQGAWNLHTLTQEAQLDFFVCFSSVSALLGSPGQGNYAAANAFMDALAFHRRALGLPGVSINWGPWDDAGMAAALSSRDQERYSAQGVKTIPVEQGLQVLGEILAQNVANVGVLPVDWSRFLAQLPRDIEFPFLEAFASVAKQTQTQKSEFRQQLEATPALRRRSLLMAHVRGLIAKVLDLKSAADIDPQQGFADLGMDSLMAVEMRNRLQNSLECSIPASIAFDYPTVEALVDYLVDLVLPTSASESDEQPQSKIERSLSAGFRRSELREEQVTPESVGDLDDLSDSEAEALLISKLESIENNS